MTPQTPITYGMLQGLLDEVKSSLVKEVKEAMTPGPQGLASPATIRGEGTRDREETPVRRVERPYREFKVAQPFSGTGSRDAGRAFLNACDRHYEDNRRFYETADDGQRVTDIAGAFTGQAETWYNNLRASQPEVVETWSGFLEVFEAMFCAALGMENKTEALFAIKMKDYSTITEYNVEFNARAARFVVTAGTKAIYREMFIAAYRQGLNKALADKVHDNRMSMHGATTEWPNITDIMAAATALAPAPRAGDTHAAEVHAAEVKGKAAGGGGDKGRSGGDRGWNKATAEEADKRGGCRFCRECEGEKKHRIWSCETFARKFPGEVKWELLKAVEKGELAQEEADKRIAALKGAAGKE